LIIPHSSRDMSGRTGGNSYDGSNTMGYISVNDLPTETDDLVVVQALSEQLDEPIGTIVVKSVFDTAFPAKLKGIVDSDSYLVCAHSSLCFWAVREIFLHAF
jgi:hypothetical protein